jgi:hypothetical protein
MKRTLTLIVAVLALGAVTVPSAAQAGDCKQWNLEGLSGPQSNNWTLSLQDTLQSGNRLFNVAYAYPRNGGPRMVGQINGSVSGTTTVFTVDWQNGSRGVYNAYIAADGWVHGWGWQYLHPENRIDWYLKGQARCMAWW